MGKDITTTQILSTCAHCGETVEYQGNGRTTLPLWIDSEGTPFCDVEDGGIAHTVDLSHAFSHMTVEG